MYRYGRVRRRRSLSRRAAQFRDQVNRRLHAGEHQRGPVPAAAAWAALNGLYLCSCIAYMFRVAYSPTVTLRCPQQLRKLASHIARTYDPPATATSRRGTNIQFQLAQAARHPRHDQDHSLRGRDAHAIQTSGNCIRNITTDQFAEAPRPTRSSIRGRSPGNPRQWSRASTRNFRSCRASSRLP